jgi:hypothetical protein
LTELDDAVRVDAVTWWHWVWPPAAMAVALAVNLAWVALLGYGIARLLQGAVQAGSRFSL